MNRREFLRTSLVLSAGLSAGGRLGAQAPAVAAPAATQFRALRGDVGVFTGRGGTIGWLASKDALVVVDTQYPDTAATCLAGLPGRGTRTLDAVIDTHHHADHTSGNPIFKSVARTLVAHDNVPKLQFAAAEKAGTLDQQVYANETFPDVWRREIGDELVNAQYHGPAHTSGDVVIHFEKANVAHVGDLMFNRMYPVIDRGAGGTVHGWIAALEDVAKTYPKDAIYVCGHGNPKFGVSDGHDSLFVMRDYFSAILDYVQKGIAAGKTKDEIVTLDNLPGFPDFHVQPPQANRLPGNLGVVYDELTEKKS
jgi:cyclase